MARADWRRSSPADGPIGVYGTPARYLWIYVVTGVLFLSVAVVATRNRFNLLQGVWFIGFPYLLWLYRTTVTAEEIKRPLRKPIRWSDVTSVDRTKDFASMQLTLVDGETSVVRLPLDRIDEFRGLMNAAHGTG